MEQQELIEENLQEVTGGDVSNRRAIEIGGYSAVLGSALAAGLVLATRKPRVVQQAAQRKRIENWLNAPTHVAGTAPPIKPDWKRSYSF